MLRRREDVGMYLYREKANKEAQEPWQGDQGIWKIQLSQVLVHFRKVVSNQELKDSLVHYFIVKNK